MIQQIIIPLLATASFVLVAAIKSSRKELIVLSLIMATLVIHSAAIMFAGLEDKGNDYCVLVHCSFTVLYLSLLYSLQQLMFFKDHSIQSSIIAVSFAFTFFSVMTYLTESNAAGLYAIGRLVLGLEFIVLIILTQRFWYLALQAGRVSDHAQKVLQLVKVLSLVIAVPFLTIVFALLSPTDAASERMFNNALFVLTICLWGYLVICSISLRRTYETKKLVRGLRNEVEDFAW